MSGVDLGTTRLCSGECLVLLTALVLFFSLWDLPYIIISRSLSLLSSMVFSPSLPYRFVIPSVPQELHSLYFHFIMIGGSYKKLILFNYRDYHYYN